MAVIADGGPMSLKALVFDLDGTILNTFPDLAQAANKALEIMGFPVRTNDELLALMGYGGRWLVEQAVPASASAEERQRAFDLWRAHYIASGYPDTGPFPGVVEVVRELRARGLKTAVVSNKLDEGARELVARHFPGLFDVVRGELPGVPRKPDATMLLQVLDELGVCPKDTAYVGDTNVDVQTARNAGVVAVGVSWGYAKADPLEVSSLDVYVQSPAELLGLTPDES